MISKQEPKFENLNVRLTEREAARLNELTERTGLKRSDVIRTLLRAAVDVSMPTLAINYAGAEHLQNRA